MYDYISSLPAYKEQGKDYCRQQVFTAIRKLQPCNDRMISDYLKWAINRVTCRRGELVECGLIEMKCKAKDPETNRTVSYWQEKQVFSQQSLF